ncbi:hypothetical protein [Streptomyces sp. NPDC020298]|uniref:hypothetical protein n=1 Tax=unclassified Streptomyces TaxID=2593676 RepID=UPI00340BF297
MRSYELDRARQDAQSRRAPAAGTRGTGLRPVRPGAGGLDSGALLALQRSAGNAAVVGALDETRPAHGAGCGHEQATPPSVQRSAVRGASGHAVPVQRALSYKGEKLTLEQARGHVLGAQSAALTPAETAALSALVEDTTQNHDVSSGEELVRLLRSHLRAEWGLTPEQVDLFDRYQGGEYKTWNKALRSGKVPERYEVADKTSEMIAGLAQIAKTKQKVQRTLSFETREQFNAYARQFEEGKEYTAVQFESTTRRLGATLDLPEKAVYVVTLSIDAQGFHGGEMSSAISVVQKSEGETVFPPGARFKVTRAPEQPPEGREFSTTSPFQTYGEMTELEELDTSKQRMPTKEESRAATRALLLGGSGLSSRPAPTAGSARKRSF